MDEGEVQVWQYEGSDVLSSQAGEVVVVGVRRRAQSEELRAQGAGRRPNDSSLLRRSKIMVVRRICTEP